MITTISFIIFFSFVATVDKILAVIPYVKEGGLYFFSMLNSVDNLVYLFRSVFPQTLSLIFSVLSVFFGVLFLFMFFRIFKQFIPFLKGLTIGNTNHSHVSLDIKSYNKGFSSGYNSGYDDKRRGVI